ncbi:DUF6301 family protein [Nocardia sp. NPDC059764]|uniref:DUF6301 family protein n=1 Tax=Nocardia sp. NPDC059764 TaxID=3346939 RepID=UPI00365DE165
MNNGLRSDIDSCLRVVSMALDYGWKWTKGDAESFAHQAGWIVAPEFEGRSMHALLTNFDIQRPEATLHFSHGRLDRISFLVTDVVPSPGDEFGFLLDAFTESSTELSEVLGDPTARFPGKRPIVRWDLETMRIDLTILGTAVSLSLNSPAYRKYMDDVDD